MARAKPIPVSLWHDTVQRSPLLAGRDAAQLAALAQLSSRFLARKTFSPVQGMQLDDAHCLLIAAHACLPVLNLGFDYLSGWREVIVYPGEFRVRREHHDDTSGIVTEGEDVLIGEAWEHGPLILSWADVHSDLEHPHDGLNVVIHEIAHKLDMRSGAADGVPPLPAHIGRRDWIGAFQQAYDAHCRAVDRGRDTLIDPYAAEAPDEYFACVSEMHFSTPQQLEQAAPAVARLLRAFYDGAAAA